MHRIPPIRLAAAAFLTISALSHATPTENFNINVPTAAKPAQIDGLDSDWNLSSAIFVCNDVENQRDSYSVWVSLMQDSSNLYVLAHFRDASPLNNPGQTSADYGFAGDCLQMRFLFKGPSGEKDIHLTAWKGSDGKDVVDLAYGLGGNARKLPNAKVEGALQAFTADTDGKGYVQEIAIPWKLLTEDGKAPTKEGAFKVTVEPNFGTSRGLRISAKDIFSPGSTIDRVFTFRDQKSWGKAIIGAKDDTSLKPVRLADGREFSVTLSNGKPEVDWSDLVASTKPDGFKDISFLMPEDGYVSLNIFDDAGFPVRQLINAQFFTKGKHTVKWDGLTNPLDRTPGDPVPAANYHWEGIWRKEIGLKLRGFAANGGRVPWDDGDNSNWGGDQGGPTYVSSDGSHLFLSWRMAEAGRGIVVTDLSGNVVWRNNRGGFSGALATAADDGTLYVLGGLPGDAAAGGAIYKLNIANGKYENWADNQVDLFIKTIWNSNEPGPKIASGMAARDGKVFLSFAAENLLAILDGDTGKLLKTISIPSPTTLRFGDDGTLYIASGGDSLLKLDTSSDKTTLVLGGLKNVTSFARDKEGNVFVGVGAPDHQVQVYSPTGERLRTIGKKGGRPNLGPWQKDALFAISSVLVDAEGKLWVAEDDTHPRRISVWDSKTGNLLKDFFGPTEYGASGGAINPLNPNIMVGEGCEWELDPSTGRSKCNGVFQRNAIRFSKFCATNGRLYLATLTSPSGSPITLLSIFERIAAGDYKLRGTIASDNKAKITTFWADENGDGQEEPAELQTLNDYLKLGGYYNWSINMGEDLTLATTKLIRVKSFTKAGAPRYDVAGATAFPAPGVPSVDPNFLFSFNDPFRPESDAFCKGYQIPDGKLLWKYPSLFTGVHGSHKAPPPAPGLIRGAFGVVGVAKLPEPIGDLCAINSNVSEWHLLTSKGFYLSRLFQADPLKYEFPTEAIPGADMTNTPPGMGGEDFGGSMTQGIDGKVYIQSGKVALWNLEVTGLETVAKLSESGKITLSAEDTKLAQKIRDEQMQSVVGKQLITFNKITPTFTGNLQKDFGGKPPVSFGRSTESMTRFAGGWDEQMLYLAWEVKDPTPWKNGAKMSDQMYLSGDTVDFQLATASETNSKRQEAELGDIRISIGNFEGSPKAVIYRKVSKTKKPKIFSSGIVKEYEMESVIELTNAQIQVFPGPNGYVVEAAIPLSDLAFSPTDKFATSGDFGVTFGDSGGERTRLRSYWNNQQTGIVDDAVFELKMEPQNWGQIKFEGN